MKKTTKHILGAVGLATVGLITAIAIGMPASALEPTPDPDDDSASVEINVSVISSIETDGHIQKPAHDSTTVDYQIPVEVVYSRASEIHYYLQYEDGEVIELPTTYIEGQGSGIDSWILDLSQYINAFGKYTFTVRVHGDIDVEDSVQFEHRSVSIDDGIYEKDGIKTDDNGEITLHVDTDPTVATVKFELQDLDGNPVIGIDGQPVVLTYGVGEINPLEIDFGAFGIPQGEYRFRVTGYNAAGAQVGGVYYLYVHFWANNLPLVPNTGGSIFAGLNLSRSDYLVSGLIVFGLVAGIGFFILRRRNSRR